METIKRYISFGKDYIKKITDHVRSRSYTCNGNIINVNNIKDTD